MLVLRCRCRRRGDSATKEQGRATAPGAAGRLRERMGCRRQDGMEGKMDTTNVAPLQPCHVTVVEPVEISFFSEREHEDATKPRHVGI